MIDSKLLDMDEADKANEDDDAGDADEANDADDVDNLEDGNVNNGIGSGDSIDGDGAGMNCIGDVGNSVVIFLSSLVNVVFSIKISSIWPSPISASNDSLAFLIASPVKSVLFATLIKLAVLFEEVGGEEDNKLLDSLVLLTTISRCCC